jgi:amino acid adenylation domain-containing protein
VGRALIVAGICAHTPATNALLLAFAAYARCVPLAPAIRANGCTVSYGGLAAATASFAGGLEAFGIGPGDVVGLTGERSAETLALILAIVASGAAYLPLDSDQGQERLVAMIEQARPRLLISDPSSRARLPADFAWCDRGTLVSPATDLHLGHSGDLAYVLFTSGSTGEPKGVAMRTAAVAALIDWHRLHPRLGQAARTLQFAATGFDVSFQEIFSTLATGGCLILPTDAERRDPWALLHLLRRERVERVFLPYVALQGLAEAAIVSGDTAPDTLRDVITAGEQLRITPALRAFFFALPDCVLHNHYGPTETHVVTAHELRGETASWPELPPIGLPLPHVRVRLARQRTAARDADDEGELLLGGDCLAAGYVGRPDLTTRSFVEIDGDRWYRTGDCVRCNASGELEYAGRLDQQIKIAGHRVEPAEIEAVLCRHSRIAQAAVVAKGGALRRLVAHVVPRELSAHEPTLAQLLASHCAAALPKHMTPQTFVFHSLLPTTPNGKVDRRALARSSAGAGVDWLDGVPLETQLSNMWLRLLGVDAIDTGANLFDHGARSLTVVHALTELRRHGYFLTVAQVYEHPSIAAQAALLDSTAAAARIAAFDQQRGAGQREAFTRFAALRGHG